MPSFFRKRTLLNKDIAPDEIFLDDRNMPGFDEQQFEGRIEKPIARISIYALGSLFFAVLLIFWWKVGQLQVNNGVFYAEQSLRNRIDETYIFPERGVISDRNGVPLAWNIPNENNESGFARRKYIDQTGFGHILGYLGYPLKDKNGLYYQKEYTAIGGVEGFYHNILSGSIGKHLVEVDARNKVVWSNTIIPPVQGKNQELTIDADVQHHLYETIAGVARSGGWSGGAGAIMDINSGELLALASYPEFDSNVMTERTDKETISAYYADKRAPFMNRAVSGVFTPGSIVKPILALAALQEKLITPNTTIISSGRLVVPNPYYPDKPGIFTDTAPAGPMTVREGLRDSSNVFFYTMGGGFGSQKGLGITRLEQWYRRFGYGTTTGIDLDGEAAGTLPNPEWKAKNFNGDPWRIGDTYFTSIGQYGVQTTLLQPLVEAAAIANEGTILTPHLVKSAATTSRKLPIDAKYYAAVQDGMRLVVTSGSSKVLNMDSVKIAAKSGTAELGVSKKRVNSWIIGFFPYDKPKYAFALVMEHGVKGDTKNAGYTMRKFLDWLETERPTMLGLKERAPVVIPEQAVPGAFENQAESMATTTAATSSEE